MASTLEILLSIKNASGSALTDIQAQLRGVQASLNSLSAQAADTGASIKTLGQTFASTKSELGTFVNGVQGVLAAIGGLVLGDKIKGMADYAARVEVLGTVLAEVGRSAGYSQQELRDYDKQVQKMGITAEASRESLVGMLNASLNPAKAAELARAAQNIAVAAGENSSNTLRRLITNVQQLDVVGLRFMGVVIDTATAYDKYAATIGKTGGQLSKAEQQQALMNAVIDKGAAMGEVYLASLGDVGKAVQSLDRYEKEYAKTLGETLLPAYKAVVDEYTTFLKQAQIIADQDDTTGEKARSFGESVKVLAEYVREAAIEVLKHQEALKLLAEVFLAFVGVRAAGIAFGFLAAQAGLAFASIGRLILGLVGMFIPLASDVTVMDLLRAAMYQMGVAIGVASAAFARFVAFLTGVIGPTATLVLGWVAAAAAAFAVGYAIGSWLNTFKVVQLGMALFVAKAAEHWTWLQNKIGLASDAELEYAKQATADAAQELADYAANKDAIDAKANKLQDLTNKQIALQKEIQTHEQAYVDARQAGNLKVMQQEQAKLKELKALNDKYTDDIKVTQASRPGVVDDKDAAKLQRLKREYEQMTDATNKAKQALAVPLVIDPKIGQLGEKYGQAASAAEQLSKDFTFVRSKGQEANVSVLQLTAGMEKLAEEAKTADEVGNAMKIIGDTAKAAKQDYGYLLQSLKVRQEALALKDVKKDLDGFISLTGQAEKVLDTLTDVFNKQAKSAGDLGNFLSEAGVNTLSSLKYATGVTKDMWGNMVVGANLYRSTITQVTNAVIADTNRQNDAAESKFKLQNDLANRLKAVEVERVKAGGLGEAAKAAALKAIDTDTYQTLMKNAKTYYDQLTSLRDKMLSEIRSSSDKIKKIDEEMLNIKKSGEEQIRLLRQKGMTEEEVKADNANRMEVLRMQEKEALANKQYDLARKLNEERKKLVDEDIRSSNLTDVSARARAEDAINGSIQDRLAIEQAEKDTLTTQRDKQIKTFQDLSTQIDQVATKLQTLGKSQLVDIQLKLEDSSIKNIINQIQSSLNSRSFTIDVQARTSGNTRTYATGGEVTGPGTGTSDSIPAWLSAGEFIQTAKATAYYGVDVLRGINNMTIPRQALKFAAGGLVLSMNAPRFAQGGLVSPAGKQASTDTINVNLNVGGQKVSLFAERQQASNLVNALKRMEAGA